MSFALPSPARLALTVLLAWALAAQTVRADFQPSNALSTPFEQWQTMKRDAFIVDTKNNVGYLVHEDGGYTSFLVATGQRRVVHYIGRTYNAQTPARSWTVNSSEIKSDRITFGRQGRFLRLTNNKDDLDTPYGIHSHAYVDKMLAGIDRYRSMGCIIVADTVLDNIIATFEMNDEKLNVVTLYGFGDQTVTDSLLRGIVAMNR